MTTPIRYLTLVQYISEKAFIAIKNNEYLWHSDNYSQLRVKLLKLAINDKRELC